MSWTYTSNPQSVPLDWIRFVIGDTNTDEQLMSDEEIQSVLAMFNNNKQNAAKFCMEHILITLSQQVDIKIGSTEVKATDRYVAYKQQYEEFLTDLMKGNIIVQFPMTGLPIFTIGMHD